MTRPIKIIAGRGGDSPASTQLGRRLLKVLVAHGPGLQFKVALQHIDTN